MHKQKAAGTDENVSRETFLILRRELRRTCLKEGDVSRETLRQLSVYMALLLKWNRRINLVSGKDIKDLVIRHICDSVRLVPFMRDGHDFIDLGSGGGLPGIVMGIILGKPGTLIESDTRKAIFLREVIRRCELKLWVLNKRIEDSYDISADIVTARALASLPVLIGWARELLHKDGYCLFLKGKKVQEEIHMARKMWQCSIEICKEDPPQQGAIVRVSHINNVGGGEN